MMKTMAMQRKIYPLNPNSPIKNGIATKSVGLGGNGNINKATAIKKNKFLSFGFLNTMIGYQKNRQP